VDRPVRGGQVLPLQVDSVRAPNPGTCLHVKTNALPSQASTTGANTHRSVRCELVLPFQMGSLRICIRQTFLNMKMNALPWPTSTPEADVDQFVRCGRTSPQQLDPLSTINQWIRLLLKRESPRAPTEWVGTRKVRTLWRFRLQEGSDLLMTARAARSSRHGRTVSPLVIPPLLLNVSIRPSMMTSAPST